MVRSCYCALLLATWGIAARAEPGPPPATVEVELAVEADAAKPTLMFIVTNVGREKIRRGDLAATTNGIVALLPSGRVDVFKVIVDDFDKDPPQITPGETVVWRAQLDGFPSWRAWPEQGLYRMYWEFGGVRSREIALFCSTAFPDDRPLGPARLNLTTPKSALWSFYEAIYSSLAELNILLHEDRKPEVRAAAKALRDQATASFMFLVAVETRFGKHAKEIDWAYRAGEDVRRAIEEGEVVFPPYFDEALLTPKDWRNTMRMVRVGSSWHVSASSFLTAAGQIFPDLLRMTEVLKHTAAEVREGRYATLQELQRVMRERYENRIAPPASRPTSRPAR